MTLKLLNKEHLVDNIWAFRFDPGTMPRWTPGQYIRVELPHDQPDAEGTKRWFTVSSAPFEGLIQITTRVTHSTFKQTLAALPVGGELQLLEAPEGDFVWPHPESDRPLLFVAGGIGVTPFRSILRQRFHDRLPLKVTLIYSGRTPDLPFRDELDDWAAHDPDFKVKYVVGEPLTAERLAALEPDYKAALVYLSGPEPMVEALGEQLTSAGLPAAQLKLDAFPNYTPANY